MELNQIWAIAEFCINAFILQTLFFQTTFPLAWKKDSHFCAILSISWPSWFIISTTQVHNPYLMVQLLSAFDISMITYFLNYSSHFYKVNVFLNFNFYVTDLCSVHHIFFPAWSQKGISISKFLPRINYSIKSITFMGLQRFFGE